MGKGACYGNFLAFTVAVAVVLAGLCGCAVGHAEVRVGEVDAPFELSPSFQAAGSASIKQEPPTAVRAAGCYSLSTTCVTPLSWFLWR